MKEALAHALSGPVSLAEDEWRERPVDRLHALGSAQIERANRTARDSHLSSLGVSIVALRDANRPDEYARAIDRLSMLMRDMRPRANGEQCLKISRQAVHESVISFCPMCHGAREVPAQDGLDGAQRMVPCPPVDGCGGTGMRRYSDAERMEALGVQRSDLDKINAQMDYAHRLLAQAESEAIRTAIRLLERW